MVRKKLKLDIPHDIVYTPPSTSTNATESSYFQKPLWEQMYDIQTEMNLQLNSLHFNSTIAAVYNPTIYAKDLHCAYLKQYLTGPKHVIFLGMNPGPWGMCQTGVPFGYVPAVRDWLKLKGQVKKPNPEHQARPVTGLNCKKSEQSGKRFWGLMEKLCETPDNLFRHCFIYNYCALAFLAAAGHNITPNKLTGESKKQLQEICNVGLVKTIELISPKIIICVGGYTKERMLHLQKKNLINDTIKILCMPHPSPLGVKDWPEKAEKWLIEHDIIQYFIK